ncbi:hypothetical protein SLITO_v1c08650 [Spiroplasma litorale]|uniref:Uncharacterized protein n=1 Tax=Spiroplasma litorale TaxID=216942 RepID=A0A0K1W2C5_9MOLU|nr:hypothetical protein [Spiroplasma litorale]AKX34480.1 hypothetical protein SLITO_v1c08650 [Spiroplasma litorale]
MKKLIFLSTSIMLSFAILVLPLFWIINSFNKNQINRQPNTTHNNNNLDENNQGFYDLNKLKNSLKSDLGDFDMLSTQIISEKFLELNKSDSKIANLSVNDVYVSLTKITGARIKLEGFIGYIDVKYLLTDISKMVDKTDIGTIDKLDDVNVFKKFKNINPKLRNIDIESYFSIGYGSLNELSLNKKNIQSNLRTSSSDLMIQYKLSNLDGLILNRYIGDVAKIDKEQIISRIEVSNESNDNYKLIEKEVEKIDVLSNEINYNNAKVQLNEENFNDNTSIVNFSVNNLNGLVTETDLGLINSITEDELQKQILNKNPLLQKYLDNNKKIQLNVKDLKLRNAAFTLSSGLTQDIKITYQCENVDGIITNLNLDPIENWDKNEPIKQLITAIKNKNPILNNIKDDSLFEIDKNSIKHDNFTITDRDVNSRFEVKINGYKGSVKPNFKVRRKEVKEVIKTNNIGKFYWTTKQEIIDRISMYNNNIPFDLENFELVNLTYDSVDVNSKTDSLRYFGNTKIIFNTDFNNNGKNMSIYGTENTDVDGMVARTNSIIEEATLSHNYTDTNGAQRFKFDYTIPFSIKDAYNYNNDSKLKLYAKITLKKFKSTGYQGKIGDYMGGYNSTLVEVPLSEINNLGSNQSYSTDVNTNNEFKDMEISYRSRNFWSQCNNRSTLKLSSTIKMSITKGSVNNDNQNISFAFEVTNRMNDYSTCDQFDTSYEFNIQKVSIE